TPSTLFPYTTLFRSSPDSNTLYTANWTFGANGLNIYDVSLLNKQTGVSGVRTAAVPVPLIGLLTWSDGSVAQQPLPVFIKGHPRSEEHTSELQSRGH